MTPNNSAVATRMNQQTLKTIDTLPETSVGRNKSAIYMEAEAVRIIRHSETGSMIAIVFRWQDDREEVCNVSLFPGSLLDSLRDL